MDLQVIKPFPVESLPRVWVWMREFWDRVADDFAPQTLDDWMKLLKLRLSLPGAESYAVVDVHESGRVEVGGLAIVEQISPVVSQIHTVFRKSFWGHEITAHALSLVIQDVFSGTTEKLSMPCFADNKMLIGLARKLGAKVEGRMEKHTYRNGVLVDALLLGLRRENFTPCLSSQPSPPLWQASSGPASPQPEVSQPEPLPAEKPTEPVPVT